MANSNSTTHVNKQVGILMGEISIMANTIHRLMIDTMSELSEEGAGSSETYVAAAERLAASIGFMADLASDKLSQGVCFGGAENWFLPPSYHHLQKKISSEVAA